MTYQEVFGVASTTSNSTENLFTPETPLGQRATRMKCFTRLHVGQLLRLLLHDNLKKKNEITKLHRSVGKKKKSGLQADITAISRSIIHNEQIY